MNQNYSNWLLSSNGNHLYLNYQDFLQATDNEMFQNETILTLTQKDTYSLDLYLKPEIGKPLICFFHGALNRDIVTTPAFEGFRLFNDIKANLLFFSDSVVNNSETLMLAWHQNTQKYDANKTIVNTIRKMASLLESQKIIFVGGSGGGFASLYYAKYFNNSFAYVWNPQTNILKYNPRHVREYAEFAFDISPDKTETLNEHICVDLAQHYNKLKENKVVIVYLQNNKDWHVKSHMIPFLIEGLECCKDVDLNSTSLQRIRTKHGLFKLLLNNWGDGHVAAPKSYLKAVLQSIIDSCNV